MPEAKKPATRKKATTKSTASKAAAIDDVKAVEKLREARDQVMTESVPSPSAFPCPSDASSLPPT